MNDRKATPTKIMLALVAAAAVIGALVLVFLATFTMGESGAGSYARAHRGESMLQMAGALVLFWIAWRCIRASFSTRTWTKVGLVLVATIASCRVMDYTKRPANVRPVGSKWHVVMTQQPREIDTVYYHLYYKHGLRYQSIADLVSEYRFVPPDCVTYRGLKVVRRPMYAMCGHRVPAETWDTTTAELELIARARKQPTWGGSGLLGALTKR